MKKKPPKFIQIITLSFAVFVFLLVAKNTQAAGATLSFDPTSVEINAGDTKTVNVVVDTGGAKVVGVDAVITYDPHAVAITKIDTGNVFADYPLATFDNTNGKASLSGIVSSVNDQFTGSGVLGTLTLQGVGAGTSEIKFVFSKGSTTDSNIAVTTGSGDILSSVNNLGVVVKPFTVNNVPTVPENSAVNTSTTGTKNNIFENVLTFLGIKSGTSATPTLNPYGPIPSQAPNTNPNYVTEVSNKPVFLGIGVTSWRYIVYILGLVIIIAVVALLLKRKKGVQKSESTTVVNDLANGNKTPNQPNPSGGASGVNNTNSGKNEPKN